MFEMKFSTLLLLVCGLSLLVSGGCNTAGNLPEVSQTPEEVSGPPPGGVNQGPIYICVMTHMENAKYDEDHDKYKMDTAWLRAAMRLFDEYDAKLTVECEREFAIADDPGHTTPGDNFLANTVIAKGHGVGTHCDLMQVPETPDYEDYVENFRENKLLVDARVGSEHNKGCSGGAAAIDWVRAAHEAGFCFMNGIVGKHYLSMDMAARPNGNWTDEKLEDKCELYGKKTSPVDFGHRIHPFPVVNADDFIPDYPGVLVVFGGGLGVLHKEAELLPSGGPPVGCDDDTRDPCFPDCEFNTEDIDVALQKINRAIALHHGSTEFAKVEFHIPPTLFQTNSDDVLIYDDHLRDFLQRVKVLVDDNKIIWGTQLEAFNAYRSWASWVCPPVAVVLPSE